MAVEPRNLVFFPTPGDLRAWLVEHHQRETELWIGRYKKGSGKPSVTWPEIVDQVLCFGWIDGVGKGIDDEVYAQRITPRKAGSIWSAVNIAKAADATAPDGTQYQVFEFVPSTREDIDTIITFDKLAGSPGALKVVERRRVTVMVHAP